MASQTSKATAIWPVASVSLLVALAALLFACILPETPQTLLQLLAERQFAWKSSTTPIPISSVSVYAKALLSHDSKSLPPQLIPLIPHDDTLPLQRVRDYTNKLRLQRISTFCRKTCDVSEVDPVYGLTPLHIAAMSGDFALTDWLVSKGAKPIEDHVGRKPSNLSFAHFISNSKKWKRQGEDCDFPIVDFGKDPTHAKSEARRLVGEGEPILMRHAYTAYNSAPWNVQHWVKRFSNTKVTVGVVPYASAFNLSTTIMSLGEYYEQFVSSASEHPSYVFNKDAVICEDGYRLLVKLIEDCFPLNLIAHPNKTGGLDGIHFFFGAKNSGAPFHVHADAINAAVNGRKRWFVFTPGKTLYSRKSVKRWVDEDYTAMREEEKPLECLQRPGDVVYVPLDWGHAVLNLDDNSFGYALEVLNLRDTLSHIWR